MTSRNGLVAEYLFDGNANDTSAYGHHGTVVGATPCADRFGRDNRAYRFDGNDDFIIVPSPPPLTGTALSVSAWARYDSRPLEGWTNCIVCQDDGNDEDQSRRVFQLSTFQNHIVWHRMVGARDPMFKRRIRFDTWYHVAAVYEDGTHALYVDGARTDSSPHRLWTHAAQPIHMGRKGTAESSFYFRGAIDDVRIYDRALPAAEVLALFREGGYEKPAPPPAAAARDALSGKWGRDGVAFLDLELDGGGIVKGLVMNGSPDNMVPIAAGRFDRASGVLTLSGEAPAHPGGTVIPYRIEGVLDDGELAVTPTFGTYIDNLLFTKSGARRSVLQELRAISKPVTTPVFRFLFALWRPSPAENARHLAERGEAPGAFGIRDARADEIPELSRVHVAAWNATYNPMGIRGPRVEIREQQWREKFSRRDAVWFCLVVVNPRGQLVGFAQGQRSAEGGGNLGKIYLLTEYQRLGLGRRLMGHVARRFRTAGVTTMGLFVDPRNPSCGFYERLGGRNLREGGVVNDSWYVWDDLEALAAACPPG